MSLWLDQGHTVSDKNSTKLGFSNSILWLKFSRGELFIKQTLGYEPTILLSHCFSEKDLPFFSAFNLIRILLEVPPIHFICIAQNRYTLFLEKKYKQYNYSIRYFWLNSYSFVFCYMPEKLPVVYLFGPFIFCNSMSP